MGKWVAPSPEERAEMQDAVEKERKAREEEEANRRRAMRLALHANVTLRSETNFYSAMTENISEGVFVATLSPPRGREGQTADPMKVRRDCREQYCSLAA